MPILHGKIYCLTDMEAKRKGSDKDIQHQLPYMLRQLVKKCYIAYWQLFHIVFFRKWGGGVPLP
jgi:hypothetical protein